MAEIEVQIIIPVYNQAEQLDVTMESIRKQNFDQDSIYIAIVDFGSDDGTYEKAMSYNRKHLGIYERPYQINERYRMSDAASVLQYFGMASQYGGFSIVLYPGDIMYPNCLSVLSDYFIGNFGLDLAAVFCESDLFSEDRTIKRQKPLFPESRVIDGSKEVIEYVRRGYRHQIFLGVGRFSMARKRTSYEHNEGRCFNKLAYRCFNSMAFYIKEPLVCTSRVEYEDELQEILFRWEAALSMKQSFSNISCRGGKDLLDDHFIKAACDNIAEYALWRSFCLYQKQEDSKAAEDSFLISRVISPDIEAKEIYQDVKRLLVKRDPIIEKSVAQYFRERE